MRSISAVVVCVLGFLSNDGVVRAQEFGRPFAKPLATAIRGTATNQEGKPVAGAHVFVLSTNRTRPGNFEPLIAEAVTDANGVYRFADVPIPMLAPDGTPIRRHTEGEFQVFGVSAGYGFTWHPTLFVRAEKRPMKDDGGPAYFFEDETCVADLKFEPAAKISGRIMSDREEPLAGVRVEVGFVRDIIRAEGYAQSRVSNLSSPDIRGDQFSGAQYLPQETRLAITDADGRYVIDGLRREVAYGVLIDYRPECEPLDTTVAVSNEKQGRASRRLGFEGTLDHSFVTPREVTVRVTAGSNGEPVSGVNVRAIRDRALRGGNTSKTDSQGKAVLRLPPDAYAVVAEPGIGMPFLAGESSLTVAAATNELTKDISLAAGAVVSLTAVEAQTRAPIAGVSFLLEAAPGQTRDALQSQTNVADYPETDERGSLTAVLNAGSYRFIVDRIPASWEPVQAASKVLELVSGEAAAAPFEFRKTGKAQLVKQELPEELGELRDLWALQRSLSKAGTYRIRSGIVRGETVKTEEVIRTMEKWDQQQDPNLFEYFKQHLPKAGLFINEAVVTVDGLKHRVESASELSGGRKSTRVSVSNGPANAVLDSINSQASITPSMVGTTRQSFGPTPSYFYALPGGGYNWLTTGAVESEVSREPGRVILERRSGGSSSREVVDGKSGFLIESSSGSPNGFIRRDWRFLPRVATNGLLLAEIVVHGQFNGERVVTLQINQLEDVKLEKPAADAFLVAAPAGTLIVDFREGNSAKKFERLKTPVADVVVVANRIPKDPVARVPSIKVGQKAPPISAKVWLNDQGETPAPDWEGKVVLIDFWGTSCGPCVAELPNVQTLAKELASDKFVLVGLHESSGELEEVVLFAKSRGLTFQLAIDRPVSDSLGFGATFKAYGIQAIPSCVVIDQEGKVAYVGTLDDAARAAERLLKAGR